MIYDLERLTMNDNIMSVDDKLVLLSRISKITHYSLNTYLQRIQYSAQDLGFL